MRAENSEMVGGIFLMPLDDFPTPPSLFGNIPEACHE